MRLAANKHGLLYHLHKHRSTKSTLSPKNQNPAQEGSSQALCKSYAKYIVITSETYTFKSNFYDLGSESIS